MAKHTYSDKVFLTLKHKIARLDSLKIVNHLISDTDSDFTRKRKLPFSDLIMIILSMAAARSGKNYWFIIIGCFRDSDGYSTAAGLPLRILVRCG